MPADLVIRGGTVFDGSGAPGFAADVAVEGGVIREIGPNLRGERELDASGCAVAPGFIDIHTHYDAQVFWDPALRPSSYHGVTTVVAGNCGFTIAPTRPEHHDVIVHTLENVEDMDPATLTAGIDWDFETFPQYLESVRRRGTRAQLHGLHRALRAAALRDGRRRVRARRHGRRDRAHVPRSCARRSMPARPGSRPASRTRTAASTASRSRAASPSATRSRRCSGRRATRARASCSSRPGEQCTYSDVYEWQPRFGRPFTYPLFAAPGRPAPRTGRAARGRAWPRGAAGLAAGHAAAAHHAVHAGRPVQPQHRARSSAS